MNTEFRAMCAELLVLAEESISYRAQVSEAVNLIDRARALLAQPVAEGPTDEEVDAWADQQEFIRGHGDHPCGFWIDDGDAGALVRAALARYGRPTPQPPAAGEVAAALIELRSTIMGLGQMGMYVAAQRVSRAADLLQHQHPQPVAVSERPWEREGWRDEQGRCWIFMPDIGTDPSWRLTDPRDTGPYHTHSLPANALPTPEANAQ